MNINLSDNIRAHRRAYSLTQQQLADALGVTVGAVYKWEANLSTPDLKLLVELADLFDTSVDVLLGYEVKSNKQADTVSRLKAYLRDRDKEGLVEAEKALIRYPNSFDVVYRSAMLYYSFGLISCDEGMLRRSIRLLERAVLLLEQNSDPEISELSIMSDIANAWSCLGDEEKMLDILKKNNPRGINNDLIGFSLADNGSRLEEAVNYLSAALVDKLAALVRIVMGYVNVYFRREDYVSGKSLLGLALDFLAGFKENGQSSLLDKPCIDFYVCLAFADLELGRRDEARASLLAAKKLVGEFDAAPDYSVNRLRYVKTDKFYITYDNLGKTAADSLIKAINDMDSKALAELWKEVEHGE